MKVTDAFVGEHAVLYPALEVIERAAPDYETVGEARAHAALVASALESHAFLEEELLFGEMDAVPEAADPLAVMRAEHIEIETSLKRARVTTDLDEARDLLCHVVDVARPHFAKEEDLLFPLAEERLPAETLLELGEQWARRRLGGSVRSGAAFADG